MSALPFPANAEKPFFGSSHSLEFRTLEAGFGDGYTQRAGDGLNPAIESWNLVWEVLTVSQKDVIYNFLVERGGYKAIEMRMPGESELKKWTCKKFSATPTTHGVYSLTGTFERVYDL